MTQPEELTRTTPLKWSAGTGVDVWAMFQAAIAGDLDTIRRLVDADPSLVRCQYAYRTPLYFAVRENRVAVARFLLEHGTDPLCLAVDDAMLDIARYRGYPEMEQLLETHLSTVQGASPRGNAGAEAIRARDLPRVRTLLEAAPELLHAGDERSNQPIHWAVMTRQISVIDELLARGADIDARRGDGARPIHLSNGDYFYRGWRDVPDDAEATPAQVLDHVISRGAYVDIWTASHMGNLARVRELLDQDPGLANRLSDYAGYYLGSGTPLRNAAARGHIDVVRLLLERGADPNLREEGIAPNGHALYSAAYNGHYEIAKLLLDHGACPNPEVESSADAMSIALDRGDQRMANLLASYGGARSVELLAHYGDLQTAAAVFAANPELADDPSALGSAVGGDGAFVRLMLRYRPGVARRFSGAAALPEITELLFAHGMDPNRRDWLGSTALHEFARKGEIANAALFLDHGADIDARDENLLSTPLGYAAKFGRLAMVDYLLNRGARTNLPDDPSWATPLAWATRGGHQEIAATLRRHGAE